ncbi:MAG TPA: malto-oligosyltrehalose synthase [Egibacteraceae bacterium]|nr:malto-oligosyltrehalose synthase [Egibacteraceae bacterium]
MAGGAGVTYPRATYRLQLGPDLDFAAAGDLVDYLASLGVSHLYLSPILQARPGSTHGYDVADPSRVADELGAEEGLRALSERARAGGLGLIVDLVPNHVGTDPRNPLWDVLLAEGQSGPSGRAFDVDWDPPLPGVSGKVILPVLGEQYGKVLHAGEMTVVRADDRWRLRYHDHDFPLSPESQDALDRAGDSALFTGVPGEPPTWTRLHALMEAQHYRLVHWRVGDRLINYRRFFAIDQLAAVRVEEPAVFDATHAKVIELVRDGLVDGLRIDHPDGLRDPARYLARLAEATAGVWTVVEKILEPGEALPAWPVAGTTGYEFAVDVLGLYVETDAGKALDELDAEFGAPAADYHEQAAAAKREKLATDLAADLRRLARAFWRVTQAHLDVRDVDDLQCREVLADVLAAMDVYRTYVDPRTGQASPDDVARIHTAVDRARGDGAGPAFLYGFLADVLTGRAGTTEAHLEVLGRFPQLSGAVMAKGVEDTAFYRHRRLVAVNEVGGDPSQLGMSAHSFHQANARRARRHPTGMLTTATHDTKRGEDVRLRIAALSEMSGRWSEEVRRWRSLNASLIRSTPAGPAPDPQTEYLAYQTLVGVWPLEEGGLRSPDLATRVQEYLVKAAREAGQRTTWTDPDEAFEDGVRGFVAGVLESDRSAEFLAGMDAVARQAAGIGMVSGLAQTLLRCTAPGVPDTYQGNELWDDSLVDPDNRRPVDFGLRRRLLTELDAGADADELLRTWPDGRAKLWVLSRALRARRDHAGAVGAEGGYRPLPATGRWADHLVAFARVAPDGDALVVAVPRLPGRIMGQAGMPPVGDVWGDTAVTFPTELARSEWTCLLTGDRHGAAPRHEASAVLGRLPVTLLSTRTENGR